MTAVPDSWSRWVEVQVTEAMLANPSVLTACIVNAREIEQELSGRTVSTIILRVCRTDSQPRLLEALDALHDIEDKLT